jgi:two-component system sensor histidine kinase YesM
LHKISLQKRLLIVILICSLLPLSWIGAISYYSIYSILSNKIESGVKTNLSQVVLSFENTLSNLNHMSQQLAFNRSITADLEKYLNTENLYEKSNAEQNLASDLNVLHFTNPAVGLMFYYIEGEEQILFPNYPVKPNFSLKALPVLRESNGLVYYGPHESNNRLDNRLVLSIYRQVRVPDRDDVYVYIETSYRFAEKMLAKDNSGMRVSHLIADERGIVSYSEMPELFSVGDVYPGTYPQDGPEKYKNHYLFHLTSNQGWSIVSVIPEAEYNQEIYKWIGQYGALSLLSIAVSLLLGWLLWRMMYKPLNKFREEINQLKDNKFHTEIKPTHIPEFDHLLNEFWQMRKRIWELLVEVEQKEKRRADLEVEKLMYQINPHFLYNTLDTVCWLARLNGQDEIDRLVTSLNKLLHYNLGKQGQETSIQQEIDALKEYLTLQQIRYDFQFSVAIEADALVRNVKIPRFILQPLVENALYHGLGDDGVIEVQVKREETDVVIRVSDNGVGLTEEQIKTLMNRERNENEKMGLGIGIHYVIRALESRYESRAGLNIESRPNAGTTILLRLPLEEEAS